tara:strand:+ start:619 stop:960 length:342 start_codon:yes stop_codon:yes gene_type:complete
MGVRRLTQTRIVRVAVILLKASTRGDRIMADKEDRQVKQITGFISEVKVDNDWGRNGVVWPDMASAEAAARDLFWRWMLTTDYRAVEVAEEPNRPTWDEWVADRGLPARSVSL